MISSINIRDPYNAYSPWKKVYPLKSLELNMLKTLGYEPFVRIIIPCSHSLYIVSI